MKKGNFMSPRSKKGCGEFSHNNPRRRREAIRKVKKEYEKSTRGKIVRHFNYVAKSSFILNTKSQIGCQKCGIDDYRVLTFHHVNPKEKLFLVSAQCACRKLQSILDEISKCNVLCKNCHEIEHDGYWRGVLEETEVKDEYPEIKEKQLQIDFKRKERIERIDHLVKTMNKDSGA